MRHTNLPDSVDAYLAIQGSKFGLEILNWQIHGLLRAITVKNTSSVLDAYYIIAAYTLIQSLSRLTMKRYLLPCVNLIIYLSLDLCKLQLIHRKRAREMLSEDPDIPTLEIT